LPNSSDIVHAVQENWSGTAEMIPALPAARKGRKARPETLVSA
jgi:hypothetical protein